MRDLYCRRRQNLRPSGAYVPTALSPRLFSFSTSAALRERAFLLYFYSLSLAMAVVAASASIALIQGGYSEASDVFTGTPQRLYNLFRMVSADVAPSPWPSTNGRRDTLRDIGTFILLRLHYSVHLYRQLYS